MMQCLLDMDGVLVDFVGGICAVHGRDPSTVQTWDFYKDWGMSEDEFWEPAGFEFWAGLRPTQEMWCIYHNVLQTYGVLNTYLFTSPSKNRGCVDGKIEWIRTWLGDNWLDRVLFGKPKYLTAGPGRVLIDDNDGNVHRFIEGGGRGLLCPRPWNAAREVRFTDFLNTIKLMKDTYDRP